MDADLGSGTWAELMRRTHHRGGVRGEEHFATSIDVDDQVARLVLRRCQAVALRQGIARPWIVDVGAGSGRLLAQLLHLGFPADRLLGVDVRPAPDLPVRWIQGVAPDCLPMLSGLVVAHEFLDDIPAEVIRDGRVERVDGTLGPAASSPEVVWAERWGEGVCGLTRDVAWEQIVGRVVAGEAIAVDFTGGLPVGHRRGRRGAWGADVCAGVDFRSLRARTGGQLIAQHRLFPGHPVLADRGGLGAFLWLFVQCPPGQPSERAGNPSASLTPAG